MKSGWFGGVSAVGWLACAAVGIGCAGPIKGLETEVATPASVAQAAARNDWQYVDNVCHDRIKSKDGANTIACKTQRDDQLKKALAEINAAECDKLPAVYDEQIAKGIGESENSKIEHEAIPLFITKCSNWDAAFERITDTEILDDYVKEKMPVELNLVRFLTKQKPFENEETAGEHASVLLNWLAARPTDYCDVVVQAFARSSNIELRMAAAPYFIKRKCVSAAGGMNEMLWNGSPRVRKQSCDALAVIGGVQSLPKLAEVVEKDNTYEMDGVERNYYVRNACSAAIRKIKERNPEPEPSEDEEENKAEKAAGKKKGK